MELYIGNINISVSLHVAAKVTHLGYSEVKTWAVISDQFISKCNVVSTPDECKDKDGFAIENVRLYDTTKLQGKPYIYLNYTI